jgi:hypothetical protein
MFRSGRHEDRHQALSLQDDKNEAKDDKMTVTRRS